MRNCPAGLNLIILGLNRTGTLARVLRLESRWEGAEAEAALAADLDGGKHAEVARTLAEIHFQHAQRGGAPLHE